MTTAELLALSPADVTRMTAKELRQVVSKLASSANKRLVRLGASEVGKLSPAYQKAIERDYTGSHGGKFGTRGKNLNQLRNEFKAARGFLQLKTSSIKGWKGYRQKIYDRIGGGFSSDVKESEFWKNYRKLSELHPEIQFISGYGSTEAQSDLRRLMVDEKITSSDELLERMNQILESAYEQSQLDNDADEFFTI